MKYNKLSLFLVTVSLASGCVAPAQTPGSTSVPSAPAAMNTLSNTPVPTITPPTATATPYSPLRTNGPYLAYQRQVGDQNEIVFLDADGKGQKLFFYPSNSAPENMQLSLSNVLSPDGNWLAYYSGSAGECMQGAANAADLTLNLMSLADGKTQIVTRVLSKDYPNIFAQAAQELNRPDITAEMLQNSFVCGITRSVAWSPDGHYLVFAGQMDGLSSDLYLYDTVAGTVQRLSSGPEEVQWIAWSPDGKWILDGSSYSVGEGMTYDIFATSVDGSSVKQLSQDTPTGGSYMNWLNAHTYFESNGANGPGAYGLKLVDLETGKKVEVWNGSYGSLAFVPDGNWAALYCNTPVWPYSYTSDFMTGIFLVNLTTLQQTRVNSLGPGGCCLPSTIEVLDSAENRMFLIKNKNSQELEYLSTDGTLSPTGVQADSYSVSPDRHYWVAISTKLQFFRKDGISLRQVDLPAGLSGQGIYSFVWRPDSSGLFFTYMDPRASTYTPQLYAVDVLNGGIVPVDTLTPLGPPNFVWVAGSK
jgi:WD40 repeat protein